MGLKIEADNDLIQKEKIIIVAKKLIFEGNIIVNIEAERFSF